MAVTQLADLTIVPSIFTRNMVLESLNLDRFIQSGVAVVDNDANAFLNGPIGGQTYNPRYIGPLADVDPNISTDDPAVKSVPNKITGVKNTAVRQSLNQSWSVMDLAVDLNGSDPVAVIQSQIAKYWLTVRQKRTLLSLKGVVADSVANHQSDLATDLSSGTGAAALISAEAIIDARQQLGDHDSLLRGMAVHSVVLSTMRKLNLIDTIPFSRGEINMPSYLGLPLLVDDGMTVDTSGSDTLYYTYLFGPGAIALGYGSPKVPYEVKRDPDAGNGGGQETVFSRVEWIVHPQGYQFGLSETPTPAQLEAAANWTRAWERKRIPLAAIISKG